MDKSYIELKDLEVYRLSRELSKMSWEIFKKLDFSLKRIIGEQFIRSADSVGANIAEGYRRFHYLDRVKFFYTSRASLSESCGHWLELLHDRGMVDDVMFSQCKALQKDLDVKLSNFIRSNYSILEAEKKALKEKK